MAIPIEIRGLHYFPGLLDPSHQQALLSELRQVVAAAPLYAPVTPGGRPMSVRMTSAGRLGWITDGRGYRYEPRHPSGKAWPPIPQDVLAIWHRITGLARGPDCCLVNFYGEGTKMGLHQDRDEGDFSFPVLSISLGDEALFRIGGTDRKDPTESFWLKSGDVLLMGGPARLAWHGIDRLRFRSSRLLPGGGRINLTLRVVETGATSPSSS
ncbi:MAG: alpha-ketoglutarate-dependent dioxygenase AlkB [Paracoccaceae bacterium]